MVENIEEYDGIGYFDSNKIIYSNGILDLSKKEFVEKEIRTYVENKFTYNKYEEKFDLNESIKGLSNVFDSFIINENLKYFLKGFFAISLFRREVFDTFESFPLFYLSGLRGKGKTFLLRLLSNIMGFEKGNLTSISSTTPYIFKHKLNKINFCNFMDEVHRVDKERIEIFKGNYDGHKIERGSINKNGVHAIQIKNESVLFLGGESVIGEEALQSRCIIHNFSEGDIKFLDEKSKKNIISYGNNFLQNILINKKEFDIGNIIRKAEEILKSIDIVDIEQRVKNNIQIVICGNLILGNDLSGKKLKKIIENYLDMNHENIEETISYKIYEDITNNFSHYSSTVDYIKNTTLPSIYVYSGKLFFNFNFIIEKFCKKNKYNYRTQFVKNQFLNYIGISNKNMKDNYNKLYMFDGRNKNMFSINKEDISKNEKLIEIWNCCILNFEKDIDYIREETKRIEDRLSYGNSKNSNRLEIYQKALPYGEKIINKNGLLNLDFNLSFELNEMIKSRKDDIFSIYSNYIKKETPIIIFERGYFLIDINKLFSFIKGNNPNDDELSKSNKKYVLKLLKLEKFDSELIEIDWLNIKTKKEFIKVDKEDIDTVDILNFGIINSFLSKCFYDKKTLIKGDIFGDVMMKEEEKQKIITYINGIVKDLWL